jgi:hypothetical protein
MSSKFAARAGVALQGVTIGTILLADATLRTIEQTRGEKILRLGAAYAEPIRFKVTSLIRHHLGVTVVGKRKQTGRLGGKNGHLYQRYPENYPTSRAKRVRGL